MFEVGDRVEWTSQSSGYRTTKRGRVTHIVPAWQEPPDALKDSHHYGGGLPRDHESYVVEVKAGSLRTPRYELYWPRVSALRILKN